MNFFVRELFLQCCTYCLSFVRFCFSVRVRVLIPIPVWIVWSEQKKLLSSCSIFFGSIPIRRHRVTVIDPAGTCESCRVLITCWKRIPQGRDDLRECCPSINDGTTTTSLFLELAKATNWARMVKELIEIYGLDRCRSRMEGPRCRYILVFPFVVPEQSVASCDEF